ncbi:hypothetical protein [Caballeronia sp. dw_19]|uniref:hypothetical protein n=1 Tax=Caballeronia sp. dw_19 TaxID=2719791 RepID=UPI001BD6D281|nr:hypothetical protein [Caballeronia sp. dw_19]
MKHHEPGHAAASAGGLLFAAILGCLSVLSACPPENVRDTSGEMKPPAGASVEAPTDVTDR